MTCLVACCCRLNTSVLYQACWIKIHEEMFISKNYIICNIFVFFSLFVVLILKLFIFQFFGQLLLINFNFWYFGSWSFWYLDNVFVIYSFSIISAVVLDTEEDVFINICCFVQFFTSFVHGFVSMWFAYNSSIFSVISLRYSLFF